MYKIKLYSFIHQTSININNIGVSDTVVVGAEKTIFFPLWLRLYEGSPTSGQGPRCVSKACTPDQY